MYEEKRFIRKKINWKSVFLKLLLIILVAFLIWFLIYKHKSSTTNPKNNGNTMNDNLKYFQDQSIKYFDETNLPSFINAQRKVTLDDMIKAGASKEIIDKDGNKCSALSSYAQVTKIDGSNYNLKVYLKCKNEADSILTTVSKTTFIENKITSKKKTTDNKKTTDKKTTTTDTSKTNTDTTNTTTTNNTNTTNTNKTTNTTNTNKTTNNSGSKSSTTSSKSSSSSSKSTSTTTSTTTTSSTTTQQSTSTSTTTNNSGSSSSTSTTTTAFVPEEHKLLYTEYRLIKYGQWTKEKPTSGNYTTTTIKVVYNRYCYGTDYNNCHVIAKADKFKNDIEYLLMQGYEEIYDHTDYIKYYQPYELIWSKTKDVEGYTYTGDHREIYQMN